MTGYVIPTEEDLAELKESILSSLYPPPSEAQDIKLIGLSGFARSGKNSVGDILRDDYGFTQVAFADKLKAVAEALNPRLSHISYDRTSTVPLARMLEHGGWESAKERPAVREFLQNLGVACREHIHPDVWVRALFDGLDPDGRYVVTDVRFPNEYEIIRNLGGQVWRVERPNNAPVNAHSSENALTGFEFNRTIHNNGSLHDLRVTVLNSI